ncbi:MAG: hydantoinase/oxoprolinase family protein, partial [Candidatus Gagatemarchaeaceae archaeon]
MQEPLRLEVAVDVGGTFTDIIASDSESIWVVKLPTTSSPEEAVAEGLRRLGLSPQRVDLLSHATTLATNALLTRTGLARAALVTNEGFRDVLEIGRQRRPEVYNLRTRRPPPLIERKDRLTLRCRIGADGSEIVPLGVDETDSLAEKVAVGSYESVAISFLNSYLNGAHEAAVRDALSHRGYKGHVSISSEVDPEHREYERTSTTVVNAVLSPLMSSYLTSLQSALIRSGVKSQVYVMNSDGGASTIASAVSRPIASIESGPAAGVVASEHLARLLSLPRVITFDMGGTTAKAGTVIGGEPDVVNEFEAAGKTHSGRSVKGSGYPVRVPFIDLAEVSAGGGSIAWVDDAGDLAVGPRSAGSDPGPACYGRGGAEPTVTDANVILGRLSPRALLGGAMPISRPSALKAFQKLSSRIGTTPLEAAKGVVRLVNNSMARAISLVSVERGRDPRDFTLLAFGGAGPTHACDLAEEMGIAEVFVPFHPGLFSAYGLLAGELKRTFTRSALGSHFSLAARFRSLEAHARRELAAEGVSGFRFFRAVDVRHIGQSHELTLPYSGLDSLRKRFDA